MPADLPNARPTTPNPRPSLSPYPYGVAPARGGGVHAFGTASKEVSMTRVKDRTPSACTDHRQDETRPREPYFRAVVMELQGRVMVSGIRTDGERGFPAPTLGEILTGLEGGRFHAEGTFLGMAEAVAHALTLPLLDPCQTVTILRPRPVPMAAIPSGKVH